MDYLIAIRSISSLAVVGRMNDAPYEMFRTLLARGAPNTVIRDLYLSH